MASASDALIALLFLGCTKNGALAAAKDKASKLF
jgi:hypothetical protein